VLALETLKVCTGQLQLLALEALMVCLGQSVISLPLTQDSVLRKVLFALLMFRALLFASALFFTGCAGKPKAADYWLLAAGDWRLVPGGWHPAGTHWLLVAVCLLLEAGDWSLVAGTLLQPC